MPNRVVKHRSEEGKPLYEFPAVASYSDCPDRLVCLSERDYNIILNALRPVEKMQTRVYLQQVGDDLYEVVSDEQFREFRSWINVIYERMGFFVECNEYLSRIADSLEAMVEAEDQRYLTYTDVLEVLNLTPTDDQQDLIEAFQYLGTLLPTLPELRVPIDGIGPMISAWRFQGAILNLLEDIAISQRGQAVAQGGIDFGAIYDTLGNTPDKLLLKAGYVGWAVFLWNRIKPRDIPNWLGWLTSISGLLLGSIRAATYNVAEAIENLALGDIAQAIQDQTLSVSVNCQTCSAEELYEIMHDEETQGSYGIVENDSTWTGATTGSPPASSDTTWTENGDPDYKCQAANYIVGWIAAFYGRSEWQPSENDSMFSLADKIRRILAEIPSIGASLNGMARIIARLLSYLSSGDTTIFVTVNEVVTDLKDDLVCALYQAAGPDEAREAFRQVILNDGRLDAIAFSLLDSFLTMNNVTGLLWYSNPEVAPNIAFYGDECPCGQCAELDNIWDVCTAVSVNPGDTLSSTTGSVCGISGTTTHRLFIRFNFDGSDYVGGEVNPLITVTSGSIVGGGLTSSGTPVPGWGYYFRDDSFMEFEEQQDDICCSYMLICSQEAFSVTIVERV
jgi:hypothetical protein